MYRKKEKKEKREREREKTYVFCLNIMTYIKNQSNYNFCFNTMEKTSINRQKTCLLVSFSFCLFNKILFLLFTFR